MEPQSSHQDPVCLLIERREFHQTKCGHTHLTPLARFIALADVATEGHLSES